MPRRHSPRALLAIAATTLAASAAAAGDIAEHSRPPERSDSQRHPAPREHARAAQPPMILSAFFGLDEAGALPFQALCLGQLPPNPGPVDGMPLVLSRTIDPATVQPSDFLIRDGLGNEFVPACATINPANEPNEERTILLVGELGDGVTPSTVEIVGSILTEGGCEFRGATAGVIPIAAGPTLILAETVEPLPAGAPAGATLAVRATWTGGVTQPGGAEVVEAQWGAYRLDVADVPEPLAPIAIGDLNDNDNNHVLYFDAPIGAAPLSLSLPGELVDDPNGELNPPTTVAVESVPPGPIDTAAPFGVIDAADVAEFLDRLDAGLSAADIAPPCGVVDALDLAAFLGRIDGS